MKPSEALVAHRDEFRHLASRYGLSRPRVFGSVLNGNDINDSDLDLLANPDKHSAHDRQFENRYQGAAWRTGSVLTPNGLPPQFRTEVVRQAEPLLRSSARP
jgi:predicted nucleotidyltransferase